MRGLIGAYADFSNWYPELPAEERRRYWRAMHRIRILMVVAWIPACGASIVLSSPWPAVATFPVLLVVCFFSMWRIWLRFTPVK
jgi:hypothetical protein